MAAINNLSELAVRCVVAATSGEATKSNEDTVVLSMAAMQVQAQMRINSDHQSSFTSHQSPFLKKVELRVNPKRYKHKYFFGTKVEKIGGVYQDPCSGDSGNTD